MDTISLRKSLESCLDEYIVYLEQRGKRIQIDEPPHPESNLIWASALASCPKLHAAERLGLVKKEFPKNKRYQFALANHAALLFKEAVTWSLEDSEFCFVDSELHIRDEISGISGTMDIALNMFSYRDEHGTLGKDNILPVEVKRTDSNRYGGLTAKFVWQTIAYIELTRAPVGYLATLYNGDSETYIRVWRIVPSADESGWSVVDDMDRPLVFAGDIPQFSEFDPTNFFSRQEFDLMKDKHKTWYENYEPDLRPVERSAFHWECAKHKAPETYKTGYTSKKSGEKFVKGDKKPSSGISFGFCPLYNLCYKKELLSAGYNPDNLPLVIPIDYFIDENSGLSILDFDDNPNQ